MRVILALAASLALCGCARASSDAEARISLAHVGAAKSPAKVEVGSAGIGPNGAIAWRYSSYGDNVTPPIRWTAVQGAGAYAVIIEDPDAPSPKPFVHWLVWNIPAATTSLPERLPARAPGAVQGRNDGADETGYYGPHPPPGVAHHYHLQVFALDGPLALAAGADRDALTAAMRGHVLADGEAVGTFSASAGPRP
jgi:Raf kinase inhibitor-like YbhB/YbcL family protein